MMTSFLFILAELRGNLTRFASRGDWSPIAAEEPGRGPPKHGKPFLRTPSYGTPSSKTTRADLSLGRAYEAAYEMSLLKLARVHRDAKTIAPTQEVSDCKAGPGLCHAAHQVAVDRLKSFVIL